MKQKEEYHLDEAIKYFYDTEPLKKDIAAAVVNRVFVKNQKPSSEIEYLTYFFYSWLQPGRLHITLIY